MATELKYRGSERTTVESKIASGISQPPNYTNGSITDNMSKIVKAPKVPIDSGLDTSLVEAREGDSFSFIYQGVLMIIYICMSVYRAYQYSYNKIKLKFLTLLYNPSKTPLLINQDINKLAKIPKRVSTILTLKPDEDTNGGLEGLLNDTSELITWSVCSGIHELSIYEKTGCLKKSIPQLRHAIYKTFVSYFGVDDVPNIRIKIPHLNLKFDGFDDEGIPDSEEIDIEISLLSVIDGRSTIVDLTKIMSELALKKELKVDDINVLFVDKELTDLVGPEPDLLILFQPSLDLQGYPPWHIRLTEIYWEPDNDQVTYSIFYRLFKKYEGCKINVGK